jgi:hypothetical protein
LTEHVLARQSRDEEDKKKNNPQLLDRHAQEKENKSTKWLGGFRHPFDPCDTEASDLGRLPVTR